MLTVMAHKSSPYKLAESCYTRQLKIIIRIFKLIRRLHAYHSLGSLKLVVVQFDFREQGSCNLCEGSLRECLRLNLYPHEGTLR